MSKSVKKSETSKIKKIYQNPKSKSRSHILDESINTRHIKLIERKF